MAIAIDRVQRDAIYSQVTTDLSGVDDIRLLLGKRDVKAALRHRRWFEDDMRLLDDLGWEPDPVDERFELTMPAIDLERLFRRLDGDASTMLRDHFDETVDERDDTQRLELARIAYREVLARLAGDTTETPAAANDERDSMPRRAGEPGGPVGRRRGRVTIEVPKARVEAVREGLRTSHAVMGEHLDQLRAECPHSPQVAATAARLAELGTLLDQLRHRSPRGQTVTGEYEPLRVAVCDALVSAIERLGCVAHSHWNQRSDLGRVRQRLGAVAGCVALLERLDHAWAGEAGQSSP